MAEGYFVRTLASIQVLLLSVPCLRALMKEALGTLDGGSASRASLAADHRCCTRDLSSSSGVGNIGRQCRLSEIDG